MNYNDKFMILISKNNIEVLERPKTRFGATRF